MVMTPKPRSKKKDTSSSSLMKLNAKKNSSIKTARPKTEKVKKIHMTSSPVILKIGQKAPSFSLPDQDGKIVQLTDYKGKKVVLLFYPKDDTPGCTKEVCSFRDGIDEIHGSRAVVFGISGDSVNSHKKFFRKFNLNFPLLSDESRKILEAYGVWKEKSLYGKKFMGIERTTFIIDECGKIDDIFSKVKVDNHLEEVLGELDVMP